jgi:hypothetical protein
VLGCRERYFFPGQLQREEYRELAPSPGLNGDSRLGGCDVRGRHGGRLFNFVHFGDSLAFPDDYWRVARVIVPAMAWLCWPGCAAGGEGWLGMFMWLPFLAECFW